MFQGFRVQCVHCGSVQSPIPAVRFGSGSVPRPFCDLRRCRRLYRGSMALDVDVLRGKCLKSQHDGHDSRPRQATYWPKRAQAILYVISGHLSWHVRAGSETSRLNGCKPVFSVQEVLLLRTVSLFWDTAAWISNLPEPQHRFIGGFMTSRI